MFTIRKLESLGKKTRLRKLVLLIQKAEIELSNTEKLINPEFFASVFDSEIIFEDLAVSLKDVFRKSGTLFKNTRETAALLRCLNNLRHAILSFLGSEPSEWDLINFDKNKIQLDKTKRKVLPVEVYLEDIRSPFNVGSIFRTAEAFGVSSIYISDNTPSPDHNRAQKTSRGCSKIVPWDRAGLDSIKAKTVFALETGGTRIGKFTFPDSGIVLIGSEELGLSPESLKIADNSAGRVSIPMIGVKRSLNVATAFGILMWKWHSYLVSNRNSSPK